MTASRTPQVSPPHSPSHPAAPLSTLCVYCGAAGGSRPSYAAAAQSLGHEMARRRISLVYGGGKAGMMGYVADAVLSSGGTVTGIITQQLMDKELGHTGIQELRVVDSMHERKKMMFDVARVSGGFVALPGGVGTLDELFEILAWAQLRLHDRPIGLLNVDGFYDPLLALLEHMEQEGFLRFSLPSRSGAASPQAALQISSDPADLLDRMAASVGAGRAVRAHGQERTA